MKYNHLTKEQSETFTDARAAGMSPARSMIAAQPELVLKKNYANVKARRLLARTDVQDKIQEKLEKMSKSATKRIDTLIQSDNEQIATTNAWKVIEHVRGTPTHRNINLNASVSIEDALFDDD